MRFSARAQIRQSLKELEQCAVDKRATILQEIILPTFSLFSIEQINEMSHCSLKEISLSRFNFVFDL